MTTADYRKAIPLKVKLQVLVNQARCAVCGERLGLLADTEFDHRPPLMHRTWNGADFVPPQHDPDYLLACHGDCHMYRTGGRHPGARKTVTTRGSDVGEAARSRAISATHEETRRRILTRAPGRKARPPSRWPKRKLGSRSCA